MTSSDPTPHRFASLDGVRALAALTVLVFHVAFATGVVASNPTLGPLARGMGNLGVSVFFVLSGFLLYRPYVTAHFCDTQPRSLRRYVRHRVLRIFPAYWLAVVGAIVMLGLAVPATVGNIFGIVTLTDMYFPRSYLSSTPVPVAWTLTAELAFYLLLPIVAIVISRGIGRRAHTPHSKLVAQLVSIGAIIVTAYLYRYAILVADATRPVNAKLWFPNFLDWFGGGMLLAVAVAWRDRGGRLPRWLESLGTRWWLPWLIAGWTYYIVVAMRDWTIADDQAFETGPTIQRLFTLPMMAIVSVLIVLPAVIGEHHDGLIARAMRTRVMVWIGMVSYGIYLWHVTVMTWLERTFDVSGFWPLLGATLGLTLPIAAASWYLLEAPLLRRKDPRPRRLGPRDGSDGAEVPMVRS